TGNTRPGIGHSMRSRSQRRARSVKARRGCRVLVACDDRQITARREAMEPPDQQRRENEETQGEAEPDPLRAVAEPEAEGIGAREADNPEADGGEDERHARVMQA